MWDTANTLSIENAETEKLEDNRNAVAKAAGNGLTKREGMIKLKKNSAARTRIPGTLKPLIGR